MPVIPYSKSSPIFYPPHETTIISRYLDLPKFLSLISTSTLFLARIDIMEDKYEGRMTDKSFKDLYDWYMEMHRTSFFNLTLGSHEEHSLKSTKEIRDFIEVLRKVTLINCWTSSDSESYALWKLFSQTDTGIMIKTTVGNLSKSLEGEKKELYLSHVRYYKEGEGVENVGNTLQYSTHKNIAYQYENEIRLIHDVSIEEKVHPAKYNWDDKELKGGVLVKVDLDTLIDEIVLGPDCQKWFEDIIGSLCEKYNIVKPIKISSLRYSG